MGAVKERGRGQSLEQNILAVCQYMKIFKFFFFFKVLSGCSNVLCAPLQLIQNTTQGCTQTPLLLTFSPAVIY